MASQLGELAQMIPEPGPVVRRPPKKFQHRLRSGEAERLVADYQAGAPVKDLVAQYNVDQSTVTLHIKQAGVQLRYPKLTPQQISKAANLCRSGLSLAAVAPHFGVDPDTVRRALLRAGVKMRDHQGR